MEHRIAHKTEGVGNMQTVTPACSCGWVGSGVEAYNDDQCFQVRRQADCHLNEAARSEQLLGQAFDLMSELEEREAVQVMNAQLMFEKWAMSAGFDLAKDEAGVVYRNAKTVAALCGFVAGVAAVRGFVVAAPDGWIPVRQEHGRRIGVFPEEDVEVEVIRDFGCTTGNGCRYAIERTSVLKGGMFVCEAASGGVVVYWRTASEYPVASPSDYAGLIDLEAE